MRSRWRPYAIASVLLPVAAAAVTIDTARVAPLDTIVSVQGVRSTEDAVSGRVVNETEDQVEEVRLLITDEFLWRDEFHPGSENPGRAQAVVVPGPIPPHGSAPFRFERPAPLPDRADGRFNTEVSAIEVIRRTRVLEE